MKPNLYAEAERALAGAYVGPGKKAGHLPRVRPGLLGAVWLQQYKVAELGDKGPEDRAALNLARAIAGLPPVGPMAGKLPGTGHWFDGAGSGNVGLMGAVAEYIRAYREGDRAVLERCRLLFHAFFAISSGTAAQGQPCGFMLSEVGSRIYTRWHVIPIAALVAALATSTSQDDVWVRGMAEEWIRVWLVWARLTQAPSGRLLYIGMRSGGHPPHPGWLEVALAVGLRTGQEGRWLAASQGTGQGLEASWEYQAVVGPLREVLADVGAPVAEAGGDPKALLAAAPAWPLWPRAEFHFASWGERGHACWCGPEVNRNKGPVCGAVERDGRLDWLPAGGGMRLPKGEDALCWREGSHLLYRSDVQGEQAAELPFARPAWEVVWDSAGPRLSEGWAPT